MRLDLHRPTSWRNPQCLAAAFDVTVEELRRDVEAEELAAKAKEIAERYKVIDLKTVDTSADWERGLASADSLWFDCKTDEDQVRDLCAVFNQELLDCLDFWSVEDAAARRETAKELLARVDELASLGCVVSVGLESMRLKSPVTSEPVNMRNLYVIVAPEDEAKAFILRDRKAPIGIGR